MLSDISTMTIQEFCNAYGDVSLDTYLYIRLCAELSGYTLS